MVQRSQAQISTLLEHAMQTETTNTRSGDRKFWVIEIPDPYTYLKNAEPIAVESIHVGRSVFHHFSLPNPTI
jgi:hypothetical protein